MAKSKRSVAVGLVIAAVVLVAAFAVVYFVFLKDSDKPPAAPAVLPPPTPASEASASAEEAGPTVPAVDPKKAAALETQPDESVREQSMSRTDAASEDVDATLASFASKVKPAGVDGGEAEPYKSSKPTSVTMNGVEVPIAVVNKIKAAAEAGASEAELVAMLPEEVVRASKARVEELDMAEKKTAERGAVEKSGTAETVMQSRFFSVLGGDANVERGAYMMSEEVQGKMGSLGALSESIDGPISQRMDMVDKERRDAAVDTDEKMASRLLSQIDTSDARLSSILHTAGAVGVRGVRYLSPEEVHGLNNTFATMTVTTLGKNLRPVDEAVRAHMGQSLVSKSVGKSTVDDALKGCDSNVDPAVFVAETDLDSWALSSDAA